MRRLVSVLLLLAAALGVAASASAEGNRYVVIVQGASGDPEYAKTHRAWVDALSATLRDRFRIEPSKLLVLAEQPKNEQEQRGTAENVRAVFTRLAKETKDQDLVFVMLIGHGTGDAAAAKFNLVGPDLTSEEWNSLLKPIPARIAFVDSTSSSFPFLAAIAGPNRIVITATNGYAQKYHTVFPDAFIQALLTPEADADKNGRISLLEAFTYTSALVARHYEQANRLATENAVLDDSGDGKGRLATATGDDGAIAAFTYLDAVAAPTATDPETRALQIKQQALTEQIDDLRRRKAVMAPALFEAEFEKLIVELALVSRDVRRRTSKQN
ncbi:MAG TPA: hypothetical protein VN700_06035 [Vicinamibacterales bacterium]|nr:hypothetical protein [Vicinamibacterales bacterium]